MIAASTHLLIRVSDSWWANCSSWASTKPAVAALSGMVCSATRRAFHTGNRPAITWAHNRGSRSRSSTVCGDVVPGGLLREAQSDREVGDRELADHERPLTQEPQDAFGAELAGLVGQPAGLVGVGLEVLDHLQRVTGDRPLLGVGDPVTARPHRHGTELVDLSPLGADLGLRDAGEHRLVAQPEHVDLVTSSGCGSDPRGLRDARGLASGAAGGEGCHGTEPTDRHRQFLALRAGDLQLLLKKLGVAQRPDLTRFRGSSASASEHLNHRRVTSSKLLDVTGFRGSSASASEHLNHRRVTSSKLLDVTGFRGSSASASEHLNHRRVTPSKLLDVTRFRGSSASASAHLTHRRGGSPSSGQATSATVREQSAVLLGGHGGEWLGGGGAEAGPAPVTQGVKGEQRERDPDDNETG